MILITVPEKASILRIRNEVRLFHGKLEARFRTAPTFTGMVRNYHSILPMLTKRSSRDKARGGKSPKRGRKYPAPAGDSW